MEVHLTLFLFIYALIIAEVILQFKISNISFLLLC
nr:MAG TPA: hypothetical protein [Caudoviricetes sp.]